MKLLEIFLGILFTFKDINSNILCFYNEKTIETAHFCHEIKEDG